MSFEKGCDRRSQSIHRRRVLPVHPEGIALEQPGVEQRTGEPERRAPTCGPPRGAIGENIDRGDSTTGPPRRSVWIGLASAAMHRHAVVPPKLRLGNSSKRPCRRHDAARGTPKVSEVSVGPAKPISSPRTGCPGGHAESVELSPMVGYGATWPHRPRPRRSKLFAQVAITHAPAVSRGASADLGAASLTMSTLRTNLIGGKFSCRRGRPAPPPVAPSRRGLSGPDL